MAAQTLEGFLAKYDPEGSRVVADVEAKSPNDGTPFVIVRAGKFTAVIALGDLGDLAAARAGGEMVVREHERMHRPPHGPDAMLTTPEVRIEPVDLDEYWAHENEIEVTDYHTRH